MSLASKNLSQENLTYFVVANFIKEIRRNPRKAHLNNFPNSAGILLSHLSRKMSCTLQMLFYHGCLPSQHEACYCCLQSGGEFCRVRAKTRRSDCRSLVCSHPKLGRNLPSHPVSSETPSILHRLFSDHRRLQILPNHQDGFCTLHLSFHRTGKRRHSSC